MLVGTMSKLPLNNMSDYMELGKGLLQAAADELPDVNLTFHVVSPEQIAVLELSPEATNDPQAKAAAALEVQRLVKAKNADAVLMLSDTWFAKATIKDPVLLDKIRSMPLKQAESMGLVELREALLCTIQTRKGESRALMQPYRRNGQDIVLEEIQVKERQDGGRFTFFAGAPTA
jgi:hypothetical protein